LYNKDNNYWVTLNYPLIIIELIRLPNFDIRINDIFILKGLYKKKKKKKKKGNLINLYIFFDIKEIIFHLFHNIKKKNKKRIIFFL